ncbi:hypothetical protein PAAG_12055 [Paracoccidioides lutzii Pb01]|uniref:Uncharacterized protein n=1 Tax=Paracoccidioides lutzii (strain ATCC MYA-826 / Pb01) TaxID=502779 RepID=A0A0A2VK69_PARBA|nr:hypothetical protein PAAG_12055 [Paracoccidioides lutzii Pb01]KGQ01284.1 hypothetical protein PAAG_12055 [Paracoccidioides lutzii Pb01]
MASLPQLSHTNHREGNKRVGIIRLWLRTVEEGNVWQCDGQVGSASPVIFKATLPSPAYQGPTTSHPSGAADAAVASGWFGCTHSPPLSPKRRHTAARRFRGRRIKTAPSLQGG